MENTNFECCICNITLPFIYKGKYPPFQPGILYKEEVFIMKATSDDSIPIPIGGICATCGKPCCLQPSCSTYSFADQKRYCINHKN